ncbi:hypothetical protein WJX81_007736 [Elliptochloris bilobata]|uniref:Serine hydrolase domain-containing protein n=1 Tax=Elliptochloris bilobata TaxID=381761 RepID=A0AAW1SF57_9CHLO
MQNAEVFRARVGSMRKALKSRADLIFVNGPHAVTITDATLAAEAGGASVEQRAWWSWQDTATAARPSLSAEYSGWEASHGVLTASLREHAPVDGILGFSQGATAASILLADLARSCPDLLPAFCILVGAFLPRDPDVVQGLRASRHAVPTLLVHGSSDMLIPLARSEALREAMGGRSELYVHRGAHLVPTCSGDFKRVLLAFLDRYAGAGQAGADGSMGPGANEQAAAVSGG